MENNYKVSSIPVQAEEKGGGYLMVFGMALNLAIGMGQLPSFGLLFGDFLRDFGEETSSVALLMSSFFCILSITGLFSNYLSQKFTARGVGLTGSFLYFLGGICQIFVTSLAQLILTFCVIQGIGFGLIIPVTYTTFNSYFVERRVFMMGLVQALVGVGAMIYPCLIGYLMINLGFRASLYIIAGINGHTILGMLLMQPGERSFKIIEDDPQSDEDSNSIGLTIKITPPSPVEDRRISIIRSKEQRSRRGSSIPKLGNWSGPILISDTTDHMATTGRWQVLVDFLDLPLLTDPVYVNILIGISFVLFSDILFFTILPMYLMFELQFDKSETSKIITLAAAADLLSRMFLALSSTLNKMNSRHVYLFGVVFMIVARFAFIKATDFCGLSISVSILGFLRTWLHVPVPLVFADHLPETRYPSGYGLFMFMQGIIIFLLGPVIGYIRDTTHSYEITFNCLSCFLILSGLAWFLEICWKKVNK